MELNRAMTTKATPEASNQGPATEKQASTGSATAAAKEVNNSTGLARLRAFCVEVAKDRVGAPKNPKQSPAPRQRERQRQVPRTNRRLRPGALRILGKTQTRMRTKKRAWGKKRKRA